MASKKQELNEFLLKNNYKKERTLNDGSHITDIFKWTV